MGLLDVDEAQAEAILSLQLRRLAALERLKIQQESEELRAKVADLRDIIASPPASAEHRLRGAGRDREQVRR